MPFLCYILLAAGLACGNYCFQMWQEPPDWNRALERSFFQLWALLACYVMQRLLPKDVPPTEMGD